MTQSGKITTIQSSPNAHKYLTQTQQLQRQESKQNSAHTGFMLLETVLNQMKFLSFVLYKVIYYYYTLICSRSAKRYSSVVDWSVWVNWLAVSPPQGNVSLCLMKLAMTCSAWHRHQGSLLIDMKLPSHFTKMEETRQKKLLRFDKRQTVSFGIMYIDESLTIKHCWIIQSGKERGTGDQKVPRWPQGDHH